MIIEKVFVKPQLRRHTYILCLLIIFVGISFSQEFDSPTNPGLLGLAEYGSISAQNYTSAEDVNNGSTVAEIDNAESYVSNSTNSTANMTAELTTADYSHLLFNETAGFSEPTNATNATASTDAGFSSTTFLVVNQTFVDVNSSQEQWNSSASSTVVSSEMTSSVYNGTSVNSTEDSYSNHSSSATPTPAVASTASSAWPWTLGTTVVSSHNLELIAADDRAGTVALAVLMSLFVVMIIGLMYYVYHKRQQRLNDHTRIQYRNDGISFENPAYGRKAPF